MSHDFNVVVFDLEIRKSIITGALDRVLNDDIEVAGWGNAYKTGISCLVSYDYVTDEYSIYGEHNLDLFVQRINSADFIVGYNHIDFDYKVIDYLNTNRIRDSGKDIDLCKIIHHEFGKRVKLDNVATSTIGIGKSGDGALAPILWQEGSNDKNKILDLIDYCMKDVNRTKRVFDFILNNGYVNVGNKKVILDVVQEKLKAKYES